MSKGLNQLQEYRNASGIKLYEKGRVFPHKNIFKVQSETDSVFSYEVDAEGATCSCKDFTSRCIKLHLQCKHQIAVEYYIKNGPLLLAVY